MTHDPRHLHGPVGLRPVAMPPSYQQSHNYHGGADHDLEHRVTILEVTQQFQGRELAECKDVLSVLGKLGWALAILAVSILLYLGVQYLKAEVWISQNGSIGHDIN